MGMLSPAELEKRKWTVGSSDVPSIVGMSPWSSGSQVLERKLDPKKSEEKDAFKIGHKLERPVAELALELGKIEGVSLVGGYTVIANEWMSTTPDFYVLRTGSETYRKGKPIPEEQARVIEIKCVGWKQLSHWDWGKKVPEYVAVQCQWQMAVLGYSEITVVALLGGGDIEVFPVPRDDLLIKRLKKECGAFWDEHLAPGKRNKVWARVKLEQLRSLSRGRKVG